MDEQEQRGEHLDARLRTVPEVAHELRVSRETVYRAIRKGELGAVRFGSIIRVRSDELERIIKKPEPRS